MRSVKNTQGNVHDFTKIASMSGNKYFKSTPPTTTRITTNPRNEVMKRNEFD